MARTLKLTVVGDPTVGKTCMLHTFAHNIFPEEYVPTIFDNHTQMFRIRDALYSVTLWDTAGQEEYERLRLLSYPGTDIFLLALAVDNKVSFRNAAIKWIPELRHHVADAPILLVGTKADRRGDDAKNCIDPEDGHKLCKKVGAVKYMECSAKTNSNLIEVFTEGVNLALAPVKIRGSKKCTIS